MLTIKKGNLFENDDNLEGLAHGCNLQGYMGAGIAAQFKERFPENYYHYSGVCAAKLYSLGDCYAYLGNEPAIFNLFTQEYPGPCAKYGAILDSVREMIKVADKQDIKLIGLPKIGCGIGGLEWPKVQMILEAVQKLCEPLKIDMIVYEY